MNYSRNQKQFLTGRFSTVGVGTSSREKCRGIFGGNNLETIDCGLWFMLVFFHDGIHLSYVIN